MKLDNSIKSAEARTQYIKEQFAAAPLKISRGELTAISDYLVMPLEKNEKKKKEIITFNRSLTMNKREVSFESMTTEFLEDEDAVYQMAVVPDKNRLLDPKYQKITEEDIKTIPGLAELRQSIQSIEKQFQNSYGQRRYLLKKQLIEMYKDQYVLKNIFRPTMPPPVESKTLSQITLDSKVYYKDNIIYASGFSLLIPKVVELLLEGYASIKEDTYEKFNSDAKYLIVDLENLIDTFLKPNHPEFFDVLTYKIDGDSNAAIAKKILEKYNIKHGASYYSTLWRKKIPQLLAEEAQKRWLIWHFTFEEYGKWRKCSRCGEVKLEHSFFFSKNTKKNGDITYYSICKECRKKKRAEGGKIVYARTQS